MNNDNYCCYYSNLFTYDADHVINFITQLNALLIPGNSGFPSDHLRGHITENYHVDQRIQYCEDYMS